jgi:hypothetical protein
MEMNKIMRDIIEKEIVSLKNPSDNRNVEEREDIVLKLYDQGKKIGAYHVEQNE